MTSAPSRRGELAWRLALAAGLCLAAAPAAGHSGPPYALVMDKPIPGYRISLWAHPDVGTGTFYILTEPIPPRGLDAVPKVTVWVQPVNRRLPKVTYVAERQDLSNKIQFIATPEFDKQEMWTIGFVIAPSGLPVTELTYQVEVTPPGLGPWDLLIYLIPIVLFGGLWGMALLRHWRSSAGSDRIWRPASSPAPERSPPQ